MRRLAECLGVVPNALYSHFADKATLLDALMDSLLVEVEVPAGDQVGWREGLVALMQSTRRFLLGTRTSSPTSCPVRRGDRMRSDSGKRRFACCPEQDSKGRQRPMP